MASEAGPVASLADESVLLPPPGKQRATTGTNRAPIRLYRLIFWGTNVDGKSAAWVEGDYEKARIAVDHGIAGLGGQVDTFAVYNETGRRIYHRSTRPIENQSCPTSVTALAGLSFTGDQSHSKHIKPKTGTYRRK